MAESTEVSPLELAARVAERLRARLGSLPAADWAIVCGSGMGRELAGGTLEALGLRLDVQLPLAELGMPAPSVPGHGSALAFGELGGQRVVFQTGRLHPYEGHAPGVATAALRAVLEAGAGALLLTCAVGAIDPSLRAGQLVGLRDQMNLFGPTPLVGPRFIDCSTLYDPRLRASLVEAARRAGRDEALREVVYAHARGPQYESPAEVAALRTLGGEVVGMSTTYEAILAADCGTPCCGLGLVTNAAAAAGLTHQEVQAQAADSRAGLAAVVAELVRHPPVVRAGETGETGETEDA